MKQLQTILPKKSGRSGGRISVRHQGGRQKRFLRAVDFKRDKVDINAKVETIEYDPNRNAFVARIVYVDGERAYILAPEGLEVGAKVVSSDVAPLEPGNTLPLGKIPVGTTIHNVELTPGKGAQLVKGAGSSATLHGKEDFYVLVKLPSAEIRRIHPNAKATIGQVSNSSFRTERVGKAGRNRRRGKRPTVRGVAMHPGAHPHGGGEGKSGVGMKHQKTYKGRAAVGKTRNKKKYSKDMIVQTRKPGKHSHR